MANQPHKIITFEHRRDPKYLKVLRERLSVDGENGLIARALPLPEPIELEGMRFKKRCEVWFLGISGNNLFDRARTYIRDPGDIMVDVLEDLFRRHREFLEHEIWLRVRFLFIYPYSSYAMSVINAETTSRRCAISGDAIHPASQQEYQVDDDRFKASSFFLSQKKNLNLIQEWIEKYDWNPSRKGSSLSVRFTPISPNMCVLIANDTSFCDSYILAKERRFDDRLLFSCPLLKIEKAEHEWAFASITDHFRYLWQLNVTLDCDGATDYEPGEQDSLGKIKPPENITFEHKAKRLVMAGHLQRGTERQWIMKVRRQLARYVTSPEESVKFERIFISCSWDDNEYGEPRPHGLALKIRDWILNDISRAEPNLQPIIVQGNPGERLSDTLFNLLDTSTLGIFLLTDDIQLRDENGQIAERMSRNNVYHELGYLMRSVESDKKIFIGLELGVKLASNLSNSIYRPIKSKARLKEARKGSENSEITFVQAFHLYIDILDWLRKESALLRDETFCDALALHEQRLREQAELLNLSDPTELSNKLKEMREAFCNQSQSL